MKQKYLTPYTKAIALQMESIMIPSSPGSSEYKSPNEPESQWSPARKLYI